MVATNLSGVVARLREYLADSLTGNAYNLIIGTGINSVLGFVFWMLATRLFAASSIGFASALISAAGLLATLGELGLGIGIIRFLPGAGERRSDLINSSFSLCAIASCCIGMVFVGGLDIWSPGLTALRTNMAVLSIFLLYTVLVTIQPLLANTFLANQKTRYFVYTNTLNASLRIALILLAGVWLNSAAGIFVTFAASSAVAQVVGMAFLARIETGFRPRFAIKMPVMRPIIGYSVGNYIGRLLFNMNTFLLPLLVINHLGAESTAYFYIAWTLVMIVTIIPSSICNSLFSESSNAEKLQPANIVRSLFMMAYLLVPVIIVVMISADFILGLFGRSYAENGAHILRLMILSTVPWGINYLYISIERIRKTLAGMLVVTASASCTSLALAWWLMLQYDLAGVAYGYCGGQAVVAAGVLLWTGIRDGVNRRRSGVSS